MSSFTRRHHTGRLRGRLLPGSMATVMLASSALLTVAARPAQAQDAQVIVQKLVDGQPQQGFAFQAPGARVPTAVTGPGGLAAFNFPVARGPQPVALPDTTTSVFLLGAALSLPTGALFTQAEATELFVNNTPLAFPGVDGPHRHTFASRWVNVTPPAGCTEDVTITATLQVLNTINPGGPANPMDPDYSARLRLLSTTDPANPIDVDILVATTSTTTPTTLTVTGTVPLAALQANQIIVSVDVETAGAAGPRSWILSGYDLTATAPCGPPATVTTTISEILPPGYDFVGVTCTAANGRPVGTPVGLGVRLQLAADDVVRCVFNNRRQPGSGGHAMGGNGGSNSIVIVHQRRRPNRRPNRR